MGMICGARRYKVWRMKCDGACVWVRACVCACENTLAHPDLPK